MILRSLHIMTAYIPCGGQVVAPFGHSQSSGAHEQDFISHLGQAGVWK